MIFENDTIGFSAFSEKLYQPFSREMEEAARYWGSSHDDLLLKLCLFIAEKKVGKDCINLQRLVLPNELESVSDEAFSGCNKLKCGCVQFPINLKETLIEAGIPSNSLSDKCTTQDCDVFFNQITCVSHIYLSRSLVFITLGSMLLFTK